jgi:NitT/TauT family transport system permease protein
VLGTQWYILFNVIAGASAFPNDYEAAANFRIRGWLWWRKVMLPGIFPYYVTGAITASGGAWNASIVSEYVSWGRQRGRPRFGRLHRADHRGRRLSKITLGVVDVDLCSGFQPRGLATDVRHG